MFGTRDELSGALLCAAIKSFAFVLFAFALDLFIWLTVLADRSASLPVSMIVSKPDFDCCRVRVTLEQRSVVLVLTILLDYLFLAYIFFLLSTLQP